MKRYIVLENGKIFEGEAFGADGKAIGETVFSTGVVGFTETLTDPSYYGQIVVQTFPAIGNYGIMYDDMESDKVWPEAYVVREYCKAPSNFRMDTDVDSFLKKYGTVGVCGVDTRALTRMIRESGVMNAVVTDDPRSVDFKKLSEYRIVNAVQAVTESKKEIYLPEGEPVCKVALYDYGAKRNIIRSLLKRGCAVTSYPAFTPAEEVLKDDPDGIMLSNGPGDPAENKEIIAIVRDLLGKKPLFGICLGHQLTALATGGKTVKLKYGHRGGNQPVKDLESGRTVITSQNHGYAVDGASLKAGKVSHINVNDNTCEGVAYPELDAQTVQFHPEACAGPKDMEGLFEQFIRRMTEDK